MNKAEKVEALEALLSRIQTNAATARATRQQLAVAAAPARSLSPVRTPAVVAPAPAAVAAAPAPVAAAPSPPPPPVRALSPARGTPAARVDTGRPEPVADRAAPKPLRMPFSGATPTPAAARTSDPGMRAAAPSAAPAGGGGLRIPSPRASEPGRPAAPKSDPTAARPPAAEPALDLPIVGASAPASSPRKPEFVDEPTIERAPEAASLDATGRRPAAPAFETGVVTAPVVDIAPASGSPVAPPPSSRRPAVEPAPEPTPEPIAAPPPAPLPAPASLPVAAPVVEAPVVHAPVEPAPAPAAVPAAAAAQVEAPPPPRAEPAPEKDESRWVAPPPAEARPSGRKSSVGLLFVAVVIIAAAGVLGYMRWSKSRTQAPVPERDAPAAAAKPTSQPEPAETGKADADDEPTAAASASAAPAASASASAAAAEVTPPKDPKSLPATIGYLVVRTTSSAAEVLDNGKKVGAVNEAIEIPCTGSRFISLGETLPNGVKPVGEGRSMKIDCQAVTTVELP